MSGADSGSKWDVHIGYLPPSRWDELADRGAQALRSLGGHEVRPGLTTEPVAWENLGMAPRWIGDDSSGAVAAIEPNLYHNRGAGEWGRFLAGAKKRGELALAISMIGSPGEPKIVGFGGPSASVSLPGSARGFEHVGGPRVALATVPVPAEGLGPADRDLALRLADTREPTLPWWSLHLSGGEVHFGGGGASQMINPMGALSPLLISAADEVVAAIWTSPDNAIRHYIVPWLPAWTPLFDWLGQRAIPEFVPEAARRIHARICEEPDLQTTAESAALAAMGELDVEHRVRREALVRRLADARAEADDLRHDLLFGKGAALEAAVSRVLSEAGCEVTPLDRLLGGTVNADLLVEYRGRRRLVEVKSASGNAPERLVETTRKHVDTWPVLRPDLEVEGIVLIVNHQTSTHPTDRSAEVYMRAEFVESLTVPVTTTLQLFHAWRRGDLGAIREAVFGDEPPPRGSSSGADPITPSAEAHVRRT